MGKREHPLIIQEVYMVSVDSTFTEVGSDALSREEILTAIETGLNDLIWRKGLKGKAEVSISTE